MIELKVDFTDLSLGRLESAFARVEKELPGWVADYIMERTRDTWGRSMTPGLVPWAPLAPSTIEARRRRNISGIRPLIATGAMIGSMRVEKTAGSARLVIDKEYAIYHQKGTSRIPKRQIIPDAQTVEELPTTWQKDIRDFVIQSFGGVGG